MPHGLWQIIHPLFCCLPLSGDIFVFAALSCLNPEVLPMITFSFLLCLSLSHLNIRQHMAGFMLSQVTFISVYLYFHYNVDIYVSITKHKMFVSTLYFQKAWFLFSQTLVLCFLPTQSLFLTTPNFFFENHCVTLCLSLMSFTQMPFPVLTSILFPSLHSRSHNIKHTESQTHNLDSLKGRDCPSQSSICCVI